MSASRVFVEKRFCPTPGCITQLNRYHAGPYCYVCEVRRRGPHLSKRQRKIVELARRGYDDVQIAGVVGSTANSVGSTASKLRREGVDVPYRKQRNELKRLMVEAKS